MTTTTTAPALIDLVEPHPSMPPEIVRYAYLNDWQGEGDIRCAVVLRSWQGYTVIWDGISRAPFDPAIFPSLEGAGCWVEALAQQWALAYATPDCVAPESA